MRSGETFFQMVHGSEKMEIPEEFVSRVRGSVGENWILVDENNKLCRVEVLREGNRYCLRRGWPDFYKHNSLKQGEFLMFIHQSHNEFRFKILCERRQEPPVVTVDELEEEIADDDDEEVDEEVEVMTAPSKKKLRRNVVDYYCADIFKFGLTTKPQNPYFVSRSRTLSRKNELYIPMEVIEDYNLKFPEKFFLVDEKGRKWDAKMKQWKDGRLWCTMGWKNMCHFNGIGMNDPCICEFVRGSDEGDGMCIRVHRVGMV